MSVTARFFDGLQDHSEIKLRILAKFLPPWRAKLGYKVLQRGKTSLWYVDGFAGKGRYGDGSEGSPIIGAKEALRAREESRGYSIGCLNVEVDPGNFKDLEKNTATFREAGITIVNLLGAFSEMIPTVSEIVGSGAPILLFIDPFGISPIKMKDLVPLLARDGETDLVITFNTRSLDRLRTDHAQLITDAIGTQEWLTPQDELLSEVFGETLWRERWRPTIDPIHEMRWRDVILYLFKRQIRVAGHFLDVVDYPIRGSAGATPKYHLIFASRHSDAYELLNDSVSAEEEMLSVQSFAQLKSGQTSFLHAARQQERTRNLLDALREYGAAHARSSRREARKYLIMNDWGEWHSKEINRGIHALVEDGTFERRPGSHGIDDDGLWFTC